MIIYVDIDGTICEEVKKTEKLANELMIFFFILMINCVQLSIGFGNVHVLTM